MIQVQLEPLTCEAFKRFGSVLDPADATKHAASNANYGTAIKISQAAPLVNEYEQNGKARAEPHINLFSCKRPVSLTAQISSKSRRHRGQIYDHISYPCQILERHPYSTQTFIPMGINKQDEAYIVIVADAHAETPDLSTVRAFVARGDQAVTYGQGVWHAPMVVLDRVSFAVIINENGVSQDDCNEVKLQEPLMIVRSDGGAKL